jgi:hypothetical protein
MLSLTDAPCDHLGLNLTIGEEQYREAREVPRLQSRKRPKRWMFYSSVDPGPQVLYRAPRQRDSPRGSILEDQPLCKSPLIYLKISPENCKPSGSTCRAMLWKATALAHSPKNNYGACSAMGHGSRWTVF